MDLKNSLYNILVEKGYPSEFCDTLISDYLPGVYAQTRMLGYLYRYSNPSLEEIVDEMIAIQTDIEEINQKKSMEYTQMKINEIYHNGLVNEKE